MPNVDVKLHQCHSNIRYMIASNVKEKSQSAAGNKND